MRAKLSLAALLLLAACGTRGSLTLPPGPPPKPVLDQWMTPAPPPAKPQAPDSSKDSKPGDDAGTMKP